MNATIQVLNDKLKALQGDCVGLESELQVAYNQVFETMPLVNDAITALANSNSYVWDKYSEIASTIHFSTSDFHDCKEYFANYMRDSHFIEVDFDNDCLTYAQGPSIVINDEGDVLDQDSGKWFIAKKDYTDDNGESVLTKRNELIEAYMDKHGYFPGVFETDRNGNIFLVKTIKD